MKQHMQQKTTELRCRGCKTKKEGAETAIRGSRSSKKAAESAITGCICSIRLPKQENILKCKENARKIRRNKPQKGSGIGIQRLQKQQKDSGIAKQKHHKKGKSSGIGDRRRHKQHKASESRKYSKMQRRCNGNKAA